MRDYQRMAPTELTDETLESILWNKALVELRREVWEIPDVSIQFTPATIESRRGSGRTEEKKPGFRERTQLYAPVTARNSPS